MNTNRRQFIKNVTGTNNKAFSLNANINSIENYENNDNILVIIQLIGGNDSLNTIIPLDMYDHLMKHRSNIMIEEKRTLKINDFNAFHPKLEKIYELSKNGQFCCIQNVGYPNQNRSHFRSMDIWNTASDSNVMLSSGWIGRYLDIFHPKYPVGYPNKKFPTPLVMTVGDLVADTCQGINTNFSYVMNHLNSIELLEEYSVNELAKDQKMKAQLLFYNDVIKLTNGYSEVIKQAQQKGKNSVDYPDDNILAQQLKLVAKLISGGLGTKIYTLTLGGFDTHLSQTTEETTEGIHATLLKTLSEAVYAFQMDLNKLGLSERILTMTYTEFGRQIASNASRGTDHGCAGSMYFFSNHFKNSIIGKNPIIEDELEKQAALDMEYDFRDVFATILNKWFKADNDNIDHIFSRKSTIINDNFI
ncbi:MAG: DUF1501 domain-containing protein [Chitinophagales bacterium]